jgi:ABC-2 type transport system permease protein
VVAQFLRLKLQLLANSFRRSPWQVVGLVIGSLYGLGVGLFVVIGLFGLRLASVSVAGASVTVFGAVLVLGFIVVPLVFGVDDTMDPRKFSLFGLPTSRLATALGVSALVSIPSLVVACIGLAQIVTWARGPLPVLLALIGAPAILATCVLCARVSTSIGAFVLASRRSRDTLGAISVGVLFLLAILLIVILNVHWQANGLAVLRHVARVVGWTPLGAVWSAPAEAAAGHPGAAILQELIALASVAALWLLWRYLVRVMLVTQQRAVEGKSYSGIGFFGIAGSSQTAVIAARSFTYWARDGRYLVSLLIIPIVPLVLIIPLMIAGVPANVLALFPVPVMALFLGWSIHNDVAYDNTAVWLHVASGTRGRSDRLGRAIPPLVIGVPVLVIASFICAALYGHNDAVLPGLIGVGIGLLLSGLGLSSVMSARFPYPVARPGDSPFAQPQASGSAAALIQSLSFVATVILALPTLLLAFMGLLYGVEWSWLALISGVGLGLLIFWAGVAAGGAIFNRRSPELLAFSVRN